MEKQGMFIVHQAIYEQSFKVYSKTYRSRKPLFGRNSENTE